MTEETDYDVVIAGAGPGGLAAALLLGHAGLRVKVLERRGVVGGRTSLLREGGFTFDVGPTFFLYPRVLSDIFREVGLDLDAEVPMVRLDPQYRLLFGEEGGAGARLDATADVERMEAELAKFNPRDAQNFRRFLSENRHKLEMFRPILESPFHTAADSLRLPFMKLMPILRPWASVDTDLKRYFSDPRLRLAFSFQAKYLGMSPFRCPSLFTILSFLEYEYGVFHPIGGCGAVSERMAELAREMGVDIAVDEPIEELHFAGRQIHAVRTNRGTYRTRRLVINADFARTMEKLVPDRLRRRWSNRQLARKKYSCSTYMLYLGIEGSVDLPHHTIYISKNYRENLLDIEHRHRLSDDPSVYVQNACVTDPTLAPAGHSTLYVLAPVSHQHPNLDWKRDAPAFRRTVLRQLRDQFGVEDLENRIRVERVCTPADWDQRFEIYRGATFNLAHTLDQMLHLRPRNRFEDLAGVYLVGGGTHPGSGLPVIYESARITSRLLLEDFRRQTPTPAPVRMSKPTEQPCVT